MIFPAVPDMAKMRVAFHSELGVRNLCSLRQATPEWKSNDYRESTPLLRERFTTLFNNQSACAGFFYLEMDNMDGMDVFLICMTDYILINCTAIVPSIPVVLS